MPRLFSICIKGAIAVVGCAVLFCVANEPGTAQYERRTAIVSNSAKKGDRLPTSAAKAPTPSFYAKPSSPRRPPLGCDPMFSPIADPAHASLYGRCMT